MGNFNWEYKLENMYFSRTHKKHTTQSSHLVYCYHYISTFFGPHKISAIH